MSKLKEQREAHMKKLRQETRGEIKKNNTASRKLARELRDELHPELFVDVKAMSARLIEEGDFYVSKGYFSIRGGEYLERLKYCLKKTTYVRTIMDGKITFVKGGPKMDDIVHVEAFSGYILDRIEKYLEDNDIGLVDTGHDTMRRFKVYIK